MPFHYLAAVLARLGVFLMQTVIVQCSLFGLLLFLRLFTSLYQFFICQAHVPSLFFFTFTALHFNLLYNFLLFLAIRTGSSLSLINPFTLIVGLPRILFQCMEKLAACIMHLEDTFNDILITDVTLHPLAFPLLRLDLRLSLHVLCLFA